MDLDWIYILFVIKVLAVLVWKSINVHKV